ncbi:MAG: hypothetical protein VKL39_06110 [Leptolyngbyaceae bacterium]|nr:hypothetical protein [Leptolyngbyaceae bacterium]
MNADQKNDRNSLFRKESLERLSSPEQLDQLMQIVTPKSWLPLGALGVLIFAGLVWSVVGRIPITVTGEGLLVQSDDGSGELIGVTYFAKADGDRIQPGMDILLLPSGISRETGGIRGRVETVAESPFQTLDDIRAVKESGGSPLQETLIEVIADLNTDDTTMSGLEMSSPSGAQMEIPAGKTVNARVTVEQRAPIAFVFPFIDP